MASITKVPDSAPVKSMIIVGASGIVISLLLLAGLDNAYACEAFPPGAPSQEYLDNSAAVFSGKVVEFEKFSIEEPAGDVRMVFFEVDRYWKTANGNGADYKQLVVLTAIDHGACGYDFEEGKSYLVYAAKWWYDSNSLYTGLGYGTQPFEDAQEHLAFLGEGKTPTRELSWQEQIDRIQIQPLPKPHEGEQSMVLSIVGIGSAIAGAVAFLTLRKRK